MGSIIQQLEKHDYPCCNISGVYHISTSATETLCGEKWQYMPNEERFKWTQKTQRLRFLAPIEISCEECLKIAKEKEAKCESF